MSDQVKTTYIDNTSIRVTKNNPVGAYWVFKAALLGKNIEFIHPVNIITRVVLSLLFNPEMSAGANRSWI